MSSQFNDCLNRLEDQRFFYLNTNTLAQSAQNFYNELKMNRNGYLRQMLLFYSVSIGLPTIELFSTLKRPDFSTSSNLPADHIQMPGDVFDRHVPGQLQGLAGHSLGICC